MFNLRGHMANLLLSIVFHILCLQALEALNWNMLHKCEHFLCGIFIFVALPRHADADAPGKVTHTTAPEKLVEFGVDSNICSAHYLRGELAHLTNGPWGALLELNLLHVLVEVDGVVPRAWLLRFATAALTLRHVAEETRDKAQGKGAFWLSQCL